MRQYYRMIDTVADIALNDEEDKGMLKRVLSHISAENRDARDAAFTLVAGLSTIRSYIDFTLHVLAKNSDYQKRAREDEEFLEKIIQETGLQNPLVPYIVRRATDDLSISGREVKRGSYVVFGWFAFGNNKNVGNADNFDPFRPGLDRMATSQGGQANVFSYGPRSCLAKNFSPLLLSATISELLNRYDVMCTNDPKPVVGGVALRYNKPLELRFIDRQTGQEIIATSSYKK